MMVKQGELCGREVLWERDWLVDDDSDPGVLSEKDKAIYTYSLVSLIQSESLVEGLGLMRTYSNAEFLNQTRSGWDRSKRR